MEKSTKRKEVIYVPDYKEVPEREARALFESQGLAGRIDSYARGFDTAPAGYPVLISLVDKGHDIWEIMEQSQIRFFSI